MKKAVRQAIYARDGHRCVWCGDAGAGLDHFIPRSHGGTHAPTNLLTCCGRCNSRRGNRTAAEWIETLWPTEETRTRVSWWVIQKLCAPL